MLASTCRGAGAETEEERRTGMRDVGCDSPAQRRELCRTLPVFFRKHSPTPPGESSVEAPAADPKILACVPSDPKIVTSVSVCYRRRRRSKTTFEGGRRGRTEREDGEGGRRGRTHELRPQERNRTRKKARKKEEGGSVRR